MQFWQNLKSGTHKCNGCQTVWCTWQLLGFFMGVKLKAQRPDSAHHIILAHPPHSAVIVGSILAPDLPVWRLRVLLVPAWVSSGYSSFLSHSKIMHSRLIGHSILLHCHCFACCCKPKFESQSHFRYTRVTKISWGTIVNALYNLSYVRNFHRQIWPLFMSYFR